jgi:hypothetical protein
MHWDHIHLGNKDEDVIKAMKEYICNCYHKPFNCHSEVVISYQNYYLTVKVEVSIVLAIK